MISGFMAVQSIGYDKYLYRVMHIERQGGITEIEIKKQLLHSTVTDIKEM
jgi:hypothetical protein